MAKLREVHKSGGSIGVTLPPTMGLTIGDWVRFQKEDDGTVNIIKVFGAEEG